MSKDVVTQEMSGFSDSSEKGPQAVDLARGFREEVN
jgi:hypothetical protein